MTMIDELFSKFDSTNNTRLIDANYPIDVLYGKDEIGRLCIVLVSPYRVSLPKSTAAMDFRMIRQGENFWCYISLVDFKTKAAFFSFCQDLIDSIAQTTDARAAMKVAIDRIAVWKKLFSGKRNLLSENAIRGLYGELYFLDTVLIPNLGKLKAVQAWSGPLGYAKDFSYGLDWYEIKTISANSLSVTISSHEQLLSENPGHLVVYKVESESESFNNGIATINDLFEKVKGILLTNPEAYEAFMERIQHIGFVPDDSYKSIVLKIVDSASYLVQEGFPRITSPSQFGEAFSKISYGLILNSIAKYKEQSIWTKKD